MAITSSCAYVKPEFGFLIGVLAGVNYIFLSKLILYVKIDDPLDAVALHFGAGLIGVLCEGLFDYEKGVFFSGNPYFLGVQCLGAIVIASWCAINSLLFVLIAEKLNILRFALRVRE